MKQILALAFIALVVSASLPEEDDVLVLSESNFQEALQTYPNLLVEFYAPWCGHCKTLAPEYAAAAKQLKSQGANVALAKVDATENQALGEQFQVEGFPTLKFFVQGEPSEYQGGRTTAAIVSWLLKRTSDAVKELSTVEEFDQFVSANRVAAVLFGSNSEALKKVAMTFDDVGFAVVTCEGVTAHAKAQANQLVVFKQFDERRNDYTGDVSSVADVKSFVSLNSLSTVMEFDDKCIERVFQQGSPTLFLFHTSSEESVVAREQFNQAAAQRRGSVLFVVASPDDGHGHFQRLADYVGVNTANVPALMLVAAGQETLKFAYTQAVTVENLVQFVDDYVSNKLKRYLKSEEVPTQEGPVLVLVGKSFENEVLNNNKDVLVKFYAPWCGHCKTLAPEWDAAAEQLKGNKNLVIAKLDSTANEVDGVEIKGFPTLKFYPGNNKQNPVDYEGERTAAGIVSWLKEHTTQPWTETHEKDDL